MPSPFPGMDPYLEVASTWGGVHQGLIYNIQAELNRHLPAGLRAKSDEYVWVQDVPEKEDDGPPPVRPGRRAKVKPDAFVPVGEAGGNGAVVVAQPFTPPTTRGRLPAGRKRKARRVVVTGPGLPVVTVIEVFSPSNKDPGPDREAYLRKRREYLASADLVEIDLLRAGERMPAGKPPPPPSDYLMLTCRAAGFPEVETWAVTVRDPLPILPVPIGRAHPPCPLDLRACLDRVYDDLRAAVGIDYAAPPEYPLRAGDAEWAAGLLRPRNDQRTT